MSVGEELRRRVRESAENRCGYCLSPQRLVLGWLEVEHIIPRAAGGGDDESNLWLACRLCNNHKSTQMESLDPVSGNIVRLFNPREDDWSAHFDWREDGMRIIGLTAIGRGTVIALQLNNPIALMVRREWIGAGWHPPKG